MIIAQRRLRSLRFWDRRAHEAKGRGKGGMRRAGRSSPTQESPPAGGQPAGWMQWGGASPPNYLRLTSLFANPPFRDTQLTTSGGLYP